MNLKHLVTLSAFALITLSAFGAKLKPALYADPTYPTKSIQEINVIGLDAREDTTLKIWQPVGDVKRYLDKKGYKVKNLPKTGFAAGFAELKTSVNRVVHGREDDVMSVEDSLRATLTLSDLTTNHKTWLADMSETAGNWIFVIVLNAAETEKHGSGYDCHVILTGYLFDREQQSLIWSDRDAETGYMAGTIITNATTLESSSRTETEAVDALMGRMVGKKLLASMPKRGKNFLLPLEHIE